MTADLLVVGAGPAGLSAAITARRRNKKVIVIGKEEASFKLIRAHRVDNYPGLPAITGAELAEKLRNHALDAGVDIHLDEVQSLAPADRLFTAFGRKGEYQGRTVVLAIGTARHPALAGEEEFLGRGVSYCATCDGMFFRGRPVAMIAYLPSALEEALFLAEICSEVYYFPQYRMEESSDRLTIVRAKPQAIVGETSVTGLRTDAGDFEVAAVFIEREALPASRLLPELALDGGFIATDRRQRTNLSGIFAAGDCTGQPWQIARAIGEGQVAALSAVEYLTESGELSPVASAKPGGD